MFNGIVFSDSLLFENGDYWIATWSGVNRVPNGDFSDTSKCNLNIKAEGANEHHKIEAIFKAFAKALRMAVETDPRAADALPSTKGAL